MVSVKAKVNLAGAAAPSAADAQRAITVSVVSHGQGGLVRHLLEDLDAHSASQVEVVLTINIAEDLPFSIEDYRFPIKVIRNNTPKGFGANHNAAFRVSHRKYFCVLNPDIRINAEVFGSLLASLDRDDVELVAPLVLSRDGMIEDSARRIPTPLLIVSKLFVRRSKPDYLIGEDPIYPDWVAGMFMLFPSYIFERMQGFDERYFLYYEDVDLCSRLRLAGYRILLVPGVSVVHDARRASHRNLRYLRWHLRSITRFFTSAVFWRHMLRLGGKGLARGQ